MSPQVETVLEARAHQLEQEISPRRSIFVSICCHVLFLLVVILAPLLASNGSEPIEFVAVQIVPLQALGIEEPAPARKRSAPTPKPKEAPKQEKAEPKVEEPEPSEPAPTAVEKPSTTPKQEASESSSSASEPLPADPARRQGSPLGSSLGTSTFGAAVGGLDNPDFVYSYYVDQMLGMISSNWQRPAIGGKVEAMVHFNS